MPPSDSFQVDVLANIIKNVVGVDKFITLSGPDLYSTSGINALVNIAAANGTTHGKMEIIKQFDMILTTSSDDENTVDAGKLKTELTEIKSRKCNVVAVFAQASQYKTLFETAAALELYGKNQIYWVVSETFLQYFLQYKDTMDDSVKKVIDGVYMADMENGKNLDSSVSRYPHLNNLWKQQDSTGTSDTIITNDATTTTFCSGRTDDLNIEIWKSDHDRMPGTNKRCTGFNFQDNSPVEYGGYTPFVYDATWAAAKALPNYLYVTQTFNSSNTFPTANDRLQYYNELLKLNFKGATGTVKFFENGDRSTTEIFYNILQVQYNNNNADAQVLTPIGKFVNNSFVSNDNYNYKQKNNNDEISTDHESAIICEIGFKDIDDEANNNIRTVSAGPAIEWLLSIGFLAFVGMGGAVNYYIKHKHQERLLHQEVKKNQMSSQMNKTTKLKALKKELRDLLIQELMIQIIVGLIELGDLITDWVAYSENSLEKKGEVVYSMYFIAMWVASCCSTVALYYRIDSSRRILSHYHEGVEEIETSKDVLDEIQELETYLNDRIDPPEYLIGKYKRRKDQAFYTLSVGILEDVPQFIFNIIKAESTVITMVSISLSAVSFGYKLSMP